MGSNQDKKSYPPLTLWHMMRFGTWMKVLFQKRPPIHWTQYPKVIGITLLSIMNSILSGLERALFYSKLKKVKIQPSPVFVIGHWRSGTTHLQNLLALDNQFTTPTSYQCFLANYFLLPGKLIRKLLNSIMPKTRPMDNMAMGMDVPQEEDIAICIMSQYSPYLITGFYPDQKKWIGYHSFDSVSDREFKDWQKVFNLFLRKVTLENPKRMLLKSPVNTFRLKIYQEMFPDAKFVYIHRNPLEVIPSAVHLTITMLKWNYLGNQNLNPNGIQDYVFYVFNECINLYEEEKKLISKQNLCEVRYEDLDQDPLREMRRIYQELHLGNFEEVRPTMEEYLESIKDFKKNKYPVDKALESKIIRELSPFFELYNYSPQGKSPT